MIILLVLSWIASGVLGAYIGHRFIDEEFNDTRLIEVTILGLFGPMTLCAALAVIMCTKIKYSKVLNTVIFKSKY
jgi:uncharacterized membrane protein AbrB (regulator of aidB expression)